MAVRSGPADLLVALASGQLELTHEALYAWPRSIPARHADQPITHQTLHRHFRKLGLPINQARVSALCQLVVEVPAPVIAGARGIHQTTATRQVANVGTTWSRYAASER